MEVQVRRRNAVRLGVPVLIVVALALVALWRVGPREVARTPIAATGPVTPYPAESPLTRVADTLLGNSIGRAASLDRIAIREITSRNTFWAGAIDEQPVFAVLRPDVRRARGAEIQEGSEVTLLGTVRPAPDEQAAIAEWRVNAATAKAVREIGTYLEVAEIQ